MVDVNYLAGLMEEVRDQNKAILEGQELDRASINKIPKIEERVEVIESDLKVVKSVVKETNRDLKNHEKRITKLESAIQA